MSLSPNFSVVISRGEEDSAEALQQTVRAFLSQDGQGEKFSMDLSVWGSPGPSGVATRGWALLQSDPAHDVRVKTYECPNSFLSALPHSLTCVDQQSSTYIVLVRCSVIPKPACLLFLADKIADYDEGTILTTFGYRLFPHDKVTSPLEDMKPNVHYKFYSAAHADRALHVFTPDFCCLSLATLKSLEGHCKDTAMSSLGHLWCSFVAEHHLNLPIWKICMEEVLDLSRLLPSDHSLVKTSAVSPISFEQFYHHSYDSNWPMGVLEVYHTPKNIEAPVKIQESCQEIWKRGFGGINMLSEPASHLDFAAAAKCGVRVLRIGAVGDARDLAYLLSDSSSSAQEDRAHFLTVLPRLRRALLEIGAVGLKVIITLVDLPGSLFFSLGEEASMPFWESHDLRSRAAAFWGLLAEHLVDLSHLIMGYDLINEPYTPEDIEVGFFDEIPLAHPDILNQFYRNTVREIRQHDKETDIILKCTWFASPIAMDVLQPLSDPNIKYSFHCYLPPHLTLHRNNHYPARKYPGALPKYKVDESEMVTIDKQFLHRLLSDHVVSWQEKHAVPSSHILVAEFGICREVPGAQDYLVNLVNIFSEFGWSWLLFSFRDEEWDALDYELGPHMSNMLHRSPSNALFMSVASHFH